MEKHCKHGSDTTYKSFMLKFNIKTVVYVTCENALINELTSVNYQFVSKNIYLDKSQKLPFCWTLQLKFIII